MSYPYSLFTLNFSLLQPWGEQRTEPPAELLPWGAETVPFLFRQEYTLLFVVVEHIVSILRVHGDDAALRRTATEIVDFATAGDVSSFLVCHSLQQFKS